MSAAQDLFEAKLRKALRAAGHTPPVCEHTDRSKVTLVLPTGIHIVDFYIPSLDLYVEYSGNNFLRKLIKMRRAHSLKGVNYFAIIPISATELGLPTAGQQEKELFNFFLTGPPPGGWTAHSENRLDGLVRRFDLLYCK